MSMTRIAALARSISATVLALCLALAFIPLGCGGTGGVGEPPGPLRHYDEGPSVPGATVAELQACADRAHDHFKDTHYALQFTVEMMDGGRVGRVKLKGADPDDAGMASCMAGALARMEVPPFVLHKLYENVQAGSPESRGLIGNPWALAAAALAGVELVPAVLIVGAVTVGVLVVVAVSDKVIEAVKRRRDRESFCMKLMYECLGNKKQPEWNRREYGDVKDCGACLRDCKNHSKGEWPEKKCPRPN